MARLVNCRDCGAKVSKKAGTCPSCGRPMGRSFLGGMVVSSAKLIFALVLLIVLVRGLSGPSSRVSAPNPSPAPTVAAAVPALDPAPAPVPSVDEMPAAAPHGLPVGATVEVLGNLMYADLDVLHAHKATGDIPRSGPSGRTVFGLMSGTRARVESGAPDAVRVALLNGNWSGRVGWIPRADVRLVPSAEELAGDVVGGLDLGKRREIYNALHQMGLAASNEAEKRFPSGELSTEPEVAGKQLAARKRFYDASKKEGRKSLIKRYKVDGATLDRIDEEGTNKRWPLSD